MQNRPNPYPKPQEPPMAEGARVRVPSAPPREDEPPRRHRRHRFSFFRTLLMVLGALALFYLLARVVIYLLVMAQGLVGGVS